MSNSQDSEVVRDEEVVVLEFVFRWGLVLGLIGGGVWGIIAPWVTDVAFWWPTVLGVIGILFGLLAAIGLYRERTDELAVIVEKKREVLGLGDNPDRYYIRVSGADFGVHQKLFNRDSGTEFEVNGKFYDWLSEGAAVVLKVTGGLDSGTVVSIRRRTSQTAQLPVRTEEEPQWAKEITQQFRAGLWTDPHELEENRPSPGFTRAAEEGDREVEDVQHWAEEVVQSFKEVLGIDALVLQQIPVPPEATPSQYLRRNPPGWVEVWLEIAEGPIRWVNLGSEFGCMFASLYIPDSRLQADIPEIFIRLFPAKSIPLFGRVRRTKWMPSGGYLSRARGFSQRVADTLNGDKAAIREVESSGLVNSYFYVSTGPNYGCWQIAEHKEDTEWSKPLWNYYQAIAKNLLAMPLPTKK